MNIKKEYSETTQLAINILSQLVAFGVSLGINFLLTPVIVNKLGAEAYGFVGLGNNIIDYAQILTLAINSMAARYIAISIHRGEYKNANRYFVSVLIANVIMAILLLIPILLLLMFIDKFFNIPSILLNDVRLLWLFIFLNFLLSLLGSVLNVATFVKNKLFLNSIVDIKSKIIRVVLLILSFAFLNGKIWYIGVSIFICTIYVTYNNYKFTKILLPEISINKEFFEWKKVKELFEQGVWNSLTKLSQVLLNGLDLLIANIFLGSLYMGILSVAKTIPNTLLGIMGTITNVFNPSLTLEYAKNNIDRLLERIEQSNRVVIFVMSIPLAFVICYGDIFYSLWVPDQDNILLRNLSILNMGTMIISSNIQVLYQVFTLTKKVKLNSIILLLTGIATTISVFILLKMTDLGIYAIAGVSTFFGIIRNLIFTPIYAAKCLNVKWYTFYKAILLGLLDIMIIVFIGLISKTIFIIDSWYSLITVVFSTGIICLIINFFILLSKNERSIIIEKIIKNKRICNG